MDGHTELNSKNNYHLGLSSGLVIALYCFFIVNMRPAIIGQKFGTLYTLFIIGVLLVYFIIKDNAKIILHKEGKVFVLLIMMMFIYALVQLLFISPNKILDAIKVFVFIFFGVVPIFILDKNDVRYFSKILIYIVCVFGVSYLITFGLILFFNISIELGSVSLPMTGDYIYVFDVLFPLSPVYNGMANIAGILMPRAIGFVREPGIYQMIIIISYWLQDYYRFNNDVIIKLILLSSLLFTFSTAGYIILLITFTIKYIVNFKKINYKYILLVTPVIFAAIYIVVFTSNQFSLINKFSNESGLSRLESVLTSIDIIRQHTLFGIGFHVTPSNLPIGINYIGTIAQLGIVGSILFLLPFYYVFKCIKMKDIYLFNILITLFLTMVLAQPIYDKAIVYLILSLILISSKTNYKLIKKFRLKYINYE